MFDEHEHADEALKEIEELQSKKEKAVGLLSRYQTQLETLTNERDELVKRLDSEFNTTVEGAQAVLGKLQTERDSLLEQAKKSLSMIDL